MASKHTPHFFRDGLATFIILGVVFLGALMITGGLLPSKRKPVTTTASDVVTIREDTQPGLQQGLQLKSVGPNSVATPVVTLPQNHTPTIASSITRAPTITPTPTPKPTPTTKPTPYDSCNHDTCLPASLGCQCKAFLIECRDQKCYRILNPQDWGDKYKDVPPEKTCTVMSPGREIFDDWCRFRKCAVRPGDGVFCIGKPVIYLYPTEKTLVDVSVETTGEIVVSDPLYPEDGGWKNVTAYPDGNLIYQNKNYRELFYETNVKDVKKPEDGIIVKKEDIEKTLKDLNRKLGLTEFESNELTDFWTSRLKDLGSKYVLISLVDQEEKNKIDRLNIKPSPNTLIEILYYFKPLNETINIKSLNLPPIPKRIGFTVIEWGGTIEY